MPSPPLPARVTHVTAARLLGMLTLSLWSINAHGTETAAQPEVDEPRESAEGLIRDTARIVTSQEAQGWFLDSEEIDEAYPVLLESVCNSTPAARRAALERLQARADNSDGQALFEEAGEWTPEATKAMTRQREALLLESAVSGAATDCPFWIRPEPGYLGRQTDYHKLTLNFETGGMLQLRQTANTFTYGGGGAARILGGYGFNSWTLLSGAEFGGGAMVRPDSADSQFLLNFFPAIPLVARFRDVAWHYEVETAAVGLFQDGNGSLSYGVRIGGGIGVSALRTQGVLPWAGFVLAYEYYPEGGGRPKAHFIRSGLRVGFTLGT